MSRATVGSRWNLDLIEDLYRRWQHDPTAVEPSWRQFFEGYDLAAGRNGQAAPPGTAGDLAKQAGVTRLIDAYREHGHYLARLDPLRLSPELESHASLDLAAFGLSDADLDTTFETGMDDPPRASLRTILSILRTTYCGTIGVEYMYITDRKIRRWLRQRMESTRNRPRFDRAQKRRILLKLYATTLFETFLHSHYIGQKRFSLEGGEMLIPLLDAIIERAGVAWRVREIVLGMPHRGRLNVLANILNKPYSLIFNEFEGNPPRTTHGDGDVKYHLGFSSDHTSADAHTVHLSLTPNPSHLEAVDPVVEGRVRAKQRRHGDTERKLGLPLLIHGDAAFAGQGIVAETLNLSQLPGYRTGGTVHVVVNNQIGFTTAPSEGRSTRYCTDVAKMVEAPVFHVNGEDPEACVHVAELALDFRQTFGRDAVIDMVCYRRHGHNEGDEPAFTQPLMYAKIRDRPSITELYTEHLIMTGDLSTAEAETIAETYQEKLKQIYDEVHNNHHEPQPGPPMFRGAWSGLSPQYDADPAETGVPYDVLRRVAEALAIVPPNFHRNPKLDRIVNSRLKAVEGRGVTDWAFAESLAFGSLLVEGTPVRLSGQDSRRGTFSQRHALLVDANTGEKYIPLNHIAEGQAQFCAYDSLLSEAAVLGFDYGYSLDEPHMLILWEAQFGDFANGAQVIIDQFIASGESKWGRCSGLVLLLPHGYEGQGPEHSSARLERYLQLCAEDNMQVVYPTTPAQYFHLLRRQVRRSFRKPLIVMTPKSLLRQKDAVSPIDELTRGGFREVMDDPAAAPRVRRVVLCSGKLYYDLARRRDEAGKDAGVALIRIEQLYPWPEDLLRRTLEPFRAADVEWVWAQEESQNMGAWTFVAPRLRELLGEEVLYVGRGASASPATGSHSIHEREQRELVEAAIDARVPHLV
jgi:2-oxoglutarate dehydrogenase E1 component